MKRLKKIIPFGILLCLWSGFTFFAFQNITSIQSIYPGISLRYQAPITVQAAVTARKYATDNKETNFFWPTFWSQKNQEVEAEDKKVATNSIFYDGDAAYAHPATFIAGTYPAQFATKSCAISNSLAWQLFGSRDVLGLPVTVGTQEYTVCGVFEDSTAVMMVSTGGEEYAPGWQNVELAGTTQQDIRTAAETFASASGLGTPASIVNGFEIASLVRLAAIFPVLLATIAGVVHLLHRHIKAHPNHRFPLVFFCLLLLALCLPSLLSTLPGWLIPSRWSDFSFWSNTAKQFAARLHEWRMLCPTFKDALAKSILTAQACGMVISCVLLLLLWRYVKKGSPKKIIK